MTDWHTSPDGWELVEYYGPAGGWNTVNRLYGPMAYVTLAQWQSSNGGSRGRKTVIRPITKDTALLSNSQYPYIQLEEEEMPDRNKTAHDDGYILANRLCDVFSANTNADTVALFAIARKFAKFEGYSDADGAFAYVEGFVSGFRGPQPKQLTANAPKAVNTDGTETTVVDGD